MHTQLLKKLGNIDQIAGIRESRLLHGRGQGIHLAEFYNAAGLRFTLIPDRCMDLYDLSYRGINLCFHSKNGLVSPHAFHVQECEFTQQWPGGALVTCGLDNVGDQTDADEIFPVHGRIGSIPALHFGTDTHWEGNRYFLTAQGEMRQSQMFGRDLSLRRRVQTELFGKSLQIHDVITNYEATPEPYLLLYHINFGYPLLQENSRVAVSSNVSTKTLTSLSTGFDIMHAPMDGQEEELYLHTSQSGSTALAVIYNTHLAIGAYVRFDTEALPCLLQWKRMRSHDYVLALEPCNTFGYNRTQLQQAQQLPVLPPYGNIETHVEIGVLDGAEEVRRCLEACAGNISEFTASTV